MIGKTNAVIGSGTSGINWLAHAASLDYFFSYKYDSNDYNPTALPETVDLGYLPNVKSCNSFAQGHLFNSVKTVRHFIFEFNPQNAIRCQSMFHRLQYLQEVTFKGGVKLRGSATGMFNEAASIHTINGELDFSDVTGFSNTFRGTRELKNITVAQESINYSVDFSYCAQLTAQSIQSIINGLAAVQSAQTITINSAITLTQTQIDDIAQKGWTLAYA